MVGGYYARMSGNSGIHLFALIYAMILPTSVIEKEPSIEFHHSCNFLRNHMNRTVKRISL